MDGVVGGRRRLDLRRQDLAPKPEQLVALCMVPASGHGQRAEYTAGRFRHLDSSRKLWFCRGDGCTLDPARLKARYALWWLPLAECPGK